MKYTYFCHFAISFQVTFGQYFYELVFHKPVLSHGALVFAENQLKIELVKQSADTWSELGHYPKKLEAKKCREEAEEEYREIYSKELEEKKSNKHHRDKQSVNLCIEKDERKRNNIDEIKTTIVSSLGNKNPTLEDVKEASDKVPQSSADEIKEVSEKVINKITSKYSIELAKQIAVEEDNLKRAELIAPRSCTTIPVTFTPRHFSNPARESKKEEEEQWLKKQAKAKERKKKIEEDLQMDHDDVVKKCQHFFKLGDYESAEEILNHGIELFPSSAQLMNNRVAVRLKLGKFLEALVDSDKCLDLMLPEVEDNRKSRAAVRCRRAFALQKLENHVEALIELEEAAKLMPEDVKISEDLESLRTVLNSGAEE